MTNIDTDSAVRDGAATLWEAMGRPRGREHECWALASAGIEGGRAALPSLSPMVATCDPEAREARRLRREGPETALPATTKPILLVVGGIPRRAVGR